LTGLGLNAYEALTGFGLLVASVMWMIKKWHDKNLIVHEAELTRLIEEVKKEELKD